MSQILAGPVPPELEEPELEEPELEEPLLEDVPPGRLQL